MDYFDYIINRYDSSKEDSGKLSSYRQAAELICMCWNKLDMSPLEPHLDENMNWKSSLSNKSEGLALHISAFSNYKGGGMLVYGVNNDGTCQ